MISIPAPQCSDSPEAAQKKSIVPLIKLLASSLHTLPSHTCISQCCLKREPARTTSADLEFGGVYNAACGNVFHLPGMSMVFTEQTGLGQRLSGPFPSSLTSGCRTLTDYGQLSFGLECCELVLTRILLISQIDSLRSSIWSQSPWFSLGFYLSFDHSEWLAPFTQMPDIPDPQCSDFLSITHRWTGIALRGKRDL